MALVFARFLFGFALSLGGAMLLVAATWLCTRLIALAIRLLPTENAQDTAGALGVAAVAAATLGMAYALGHALYRALGDSALVGSLPHWLAGADNLSAAAVLGALVALGLLAYVPAMARRLRRDPAARTAGDDAPAPKPAPRAEPVRAAARPKPKAAADVRPKGPRIPQLGWLALFLLAIGAALLAFAFIVAPMSPAGPAALAAQHAARARPVYLAGAALVGAGALCLLAWLFWRRAPQAGKPARAARTPK